MFFGVWLETVLSRQAELGESTTTIDDVTMRLAGEFLRGVVRSVDVDHEPWRDAAALAGSGHAVAAATIASGPGWAPSKRARWLYRLTGLMWGVHDSERTDRLNPSYVIKNDGSLKDLYNALDVIIEVETTRRTMPPAANNDDLPVPLLFMHGPIIGLVVPRATRLTTKGAL